MKSTGGQIDRSAQIAAGAVMLTVCPGKDARRKILQGLLRPTACAENMVPEAWATPRFNNGFRLNAVLVEAPTGKPSPTVESAFPILRVLTQGSLPDAVAQADARDADAPTVIPASCTSIPVPRHAAALAASNAVALHKWIDPIQEAHHRYIKPAPSGASNGGIQVQSAWSNPRKHFSHSQARLLHRSRTPMDPKKRDAPACPITATPAWHAD